MRRYLGWLTQGFMVRQMQPWHENLGKRVGVEIKRADAPGMTRSMQIARADLGLDRLLVVYPGTRQYALAAGVDVVPVARVAEFIA